MPDRQLENRRFEDDPFYLSSTQRLGSSRSSTSGHPQAFSELGRDNAPHGKSKKSQIGKTASIMSWSTEIVSVCFALGLLLAIFIVLATQNGKPVEGWKTPESIRSLGLVMPATLTLNTIVALLSTFFRAAVVAVAAEIISQSKWSWFWSAYSPARPLRDLQYFENGSRGILGALRLIPIVLRKSPAALIAAVILILSFAVGPFVQQAIHIVPYDVPLERGTASIPIITYLNDFSMYYRTLQGGIYHGFFDATPKTRSVLYSTLGNPSGNDSNIAPHCPTGNCNFPGWDPKSSDVEGEGITTASLAVCSKCFDVGTLITERPNNFSGPARTFGLPNNMTVNSMDQYDWMSIKTGNLSWAEAVIPQSTAARLRWALANVTVLTMTNEDTNSTYRSTPNTSIAITCSLYPCLRTYSSYVRSGQLTENTLSSSPLYPDIRKYTEAGPEFVSEFKPEDLFDSTDNRIFNFTAVQYPCRVNDEVYISSNASSIPENITSVVRLYDPDQSPDYPSITAPEPCVYRVDSSIRGILAAVLSDSGEIFDGSCIWDSRQGTIPGCHDKKWWLAQFWEQGNSTTSTIEKRLSSIADAMTNQMRLGFLGTPTEIQGSALVSVSHNLIVWQWLALPTALLALELIILGWMISRSLQRNVRDVAWKSNILALLYYQNRFVSSDGNTFRDEHRRANIEEDNLKYDLMTSKQLESDAEKIRVSFRRRGNGETENHVDGRRDVELQNLSRGSLLVDD